MPRPPPELELVAVSPAVTAVPACKAAVDPSTAPGWSMALVPLALPMAEKELALPKLGCRSLPAVTSRLRATPPILQPGEVDVSGSVPADTPLASGLRFSCDDVCETSAVSPAVTPSSLTFEVRPKAGQLSLPIRVGSPTRNPSRRLFCLTAPSAPAIPGSPLVAFAWDWCNGRADHPAAASSDATVATAGPRRRLLVLISASAPPCRSPASRRCRA
ncbi:hypothetical protein ACVIIY_005052 [Bradyrhizobium sp. USDA 4515]|nr:hypothetical protein [Bradyrhizobium sp. USDA 4545]